MLTNMYPVLQILQHPLRHLSGDPGARHVFSCDLRVLFRTRFKKLQQPHVSCSRKGLQGWSTIYTLHVASITARAAILLLHWTGLVALLLLLN